MFAEVVVQWWEDREEGGRIGRKGGGGEGCISLGGNILLRGNSVSILFISPEQVGTSVHEQITITHCYVLFTYLLT